MATTFDGKGTLRKTRDQYCCRNMEAYGWLEDTLGVDIALLGRPVCTGEGIVRRTPLK